MQRTTGEARGEVNPSGRSEEGAHAKPDTGVGGWEGEGEPNANRPSRE